MCPLKHGFPLSRERRRNEIARKEGHSRAQEGRFRRRSSCSTSSCLICKVSGHFAERTLLAPENNCSHYADSSKSHTSHPMLYTVPRGGRSFSLVNIIPSSSSASSGRADGPFEMQINTKLPSGRMTKTPGSANRRSVSDGDRGSVT